MCVMYSRSGLRIVSVVFTEGTYSQQQSAKVAGWEEQGCCRSDPMDFWQKRSHYCMTNLWLELGNLPPSFWTHAHQHSLRCSVVEYRESVKGKQMWMPWNFWEGWGYEQQDHGYHRDHQSLTFSDREQNSTAPQKWRVLYRCGAHFNCMVWIHPYPLKKTSVSYHNGNEWTNSLNVKAMSKHFSPAVNCLSRWQGQNDRGWEYMLSPNSLRITTWTLPICHVLLKSPESEHSEHLWDIPKQHFRQHFPPSSSQNSKTFLSESGAVLLQQDSRCWWL